MKPKSHAHDEPFLNRLTVEPLTQGNWRKFERLFGERGACGNCWCMYYRLKKADFNEGKHLDGNKDAMKALVWTGRPAGMMAFYEDRPVAWCAFAPREDFVKLEKSRVHKRIDDAAVWSIPCLFVEKPFRRQGVSVALLKGVIAYAREHGIGVIEAYPAIPTQDTLPDAFAWIGLYSAFEQAGFRIVDRTSKHRPMVRWYAHAR